MAKDKEKRQINPATAALKAAKKRTINKQKIAQEALRTEKLAKRNPERIRAQIAELKEQKEANGGTLLAREHKLLEDLERDVGRIERIREKTGAPPPSVASSGAKGEKKKNPREEQRERREGILGKRAREEPRKYKSDDPRARFQEQMRKRQKTPESETDDEAREIPMPTDVENMPPIPRKPRTVHALPDAPTHQEQKLPAQTVYSSAPQLRDLHKEAVSRFVPAVVASRIKAVKGEGGRLLEPEEADALEAAGYTAGTGVASRPVASAGRDDGSNTIPGADHAAREARKAEARDIVDRIADEAEKEVEYTLMAREAQEGPAGSLEEEERRFLEEVGHVEMDVVEDGGDDVAGLQSPGEGGKYVVEMEEVVDEDL